MASLVSVSLCELVLWRIWREGQMWNYEKRLMEGDHVEEEEEEDGW